MRKWMCLPISGLLLVANHAAPVAPQDPGANPPEKKICRMITKVGTIIPMRTCLTKAEWKQLGEASETRNDIYRNRISFGCGKAYSKNSCTPE
jgi:hypothetical protein